MSSDPGPASELGEFLKARRAALRPRDVGLDGTGSPRRVPGLRREEVAQLAAMSVDYYTRLEQGRLPASAAIIAVLAKALRLDEDQQAYAYQLAGKTPAAPRRPRAQRVTPAMRRLLDQLAGTPAMVLGRRMDVLAWNSGAAALYTDFARYPEQHRNYVWLLFTDPAVRALHADWERAARTATATLRMEAARHPGDPRLATLVGELSVRDEDFRTWWAEHRVTSTGNGTKHYRHPIAGELILDCDTWVSPEDEDQRILILTAEPGTPSYDGLRFLASWAAEAPTPGRTP
ncbi:helix-turn-helix transcriptional regulator [Amycolatopsis sp. NBC_00345]|uniref:helix-turn-helix domain-containing protein n=1 Tax=Amycolatopsis sp. NBC_00345 TaxID=2975955 RepID=UPI002E25A5B6